MNNNGRERARRSEGEGKDKFKSEMGSRRSILNQIQAKLDAINEQRDRERQEFRDSHVWTFRTEPPKEFARFDPEYRHLFTSDNKEASMDTNL